MADECSDPRAPLRPQLGILHIRASLDLDTVLAEVAHRARAFSDSHYGVITTADEAGAPRDLAFADFTPDEERELAASLGSARLLAHLCDLPGLLRLAELAG
ncbi:MAG: hypothetical protein OXN96_22755 [Bryobacterales bacterium]|nr:hypothetical protein [Bryobacterales bacterium]